MNVPLYRWVFLTIVLISVVATVSHALGHEPYPAFIGPSFGGVQYRGDLIVTEEGRVYAVYGKQKRKVNQRKLLAPIRAPQRWVVQKWIRNDPFESKEARDWLRDRLRSAGVSKPPDSVLLQWVERPYDLTKQRYVGGTKVLAERWVRL